MSWILLVALAQTPDQVDAFLKGDEAARAELLKLGVYSIRPLQKKRNGDPRKIDALIFEIKVANAYPSPVTLPGRFAEREGMVANRQWSDPALLVRLFWQLEIPLFTDQFDTARLKPARMAVFNPATRLQLVEMFCQDTGLDYGFFHNSVVVGSPERFWPDQGPPKVKRLDESALAQARALIGKLEDASIEVREAASRDLLALGTGVIPLLEANRKQADPELVSRCEAMLRVLRQEWCSFGPAGCLRQKLRREDDALLGKLKKVTPKLAFDLAPISEILAGLRMAHGVTFQIAPDLAMKRSTIHAAGQSLLDVLSLITQSHDLDFLIADGTVVIDARGVIDRRIAPGK
jgi:hypothetical protein